jgi:hypothetical protein
MEVPPKQMHASKQRTAMFETTEGPRGVTFSKPNDGGGNLVSSADEAY